MCAYSGTYMMVSIKISYNVVKKYIIKMTTKFSKLTIYSNVQYILYK